MIRASISGAVAASLLVLVAPASHAAERLVVSSGHQGGWDSLVTAFGVRKGIFQEQGLDVEIVDIDTGAPMLQAVVSGSIDVAIGVGMPGFIGAVMKDAPLKMVSANFTGAPDLGWYVRAESPIKSFADIARDNTVGYSSNGSSTQIVLLALMKQAGVDGQPVAAGNATATLTQVMTGQIDVGYDGNGGMGISEFQRGDVRFIGSGADLESYRDQTVRGIVVTVETLAKRRDALIDFLAAYQQAIDWMYQDPVAYEWFAEAIKTSVAEAKTTVQRIYPRAALQLGPVQGLDRTIVQSVEFKRIPAAPTAEQIAKMFEYIGPSPAGK
ncbi:MAG: ABC transporter substrate-binding protein [Bauldia sp.]